MALMEFKEAFAHMKRNPGAKLRFWYCAKDSQGKALLLVAPPHAVVAHADTKAIQAAAQSKESCAGEIEIDAEGALVLTPFHKKLNAISVRLKVFVHEQGCRPTSIEVRDPRGEPAEDGALKSKALDPNYLGEEQQRAWRAKHSPEAKRAGGTLPPEQLREISERTDFVTKYMDEDEREDVEISADETGKMQMTSKGRELKDRQHGVVMDPATRKLYTFGGYEDSADGRQRRLHQHSTPLAGAPVAAAGHLHTEDGRIVTVDDASGHYKPTAEYTLQLVKHLDELGLMVNHRSYADAQHGDDLNEVSRASWEQAYARVERARKMLFELDGERKRLAAVVHAADAAGDAAGLQKALSELDANAAKLERVTDALADEVAVIETAVVPDDAALDDLELRLPRKALAVARGEHGVSVDPGQFAAVAGDREAINALLRDMLDDLAPQLPPQTPAALLRSLAAVDAYVDRELRRKGVDAVMRAAREQLNDAAPMHHETEIHLQGKVGISDAEFAQLRARWREDAQDPTLDPMELLTRRRQSVIELLNRKAGADPKRDKRLAKIPAADFESLPALNLKIGHADRIELLASTFLAIRGDERLARQKRAVGQELKAAVAAREARRNPQAPAANAVVGGGDGAETSADTAPDAREPFGYGSAEAEEREVSRAAPRSGGGYGGGMFDDEEDEDEDASALRPDGAYGGGAQDAEEDEDDEDGSALRPDGAYGGSAQDAEEDEDDEDRSALRPDGAYGGAAQDAEEDEEDEDRSALRPDGAYGGSQDADEDEAD